MINCCKFLEKINSLVWKRHWLFIIRPIKVEGLSIYFMAGNLAVNSENQTQAFLIKDINYWSQTEQYSPEASIIWEIIKVLFEMLIYTQAGPVKVSDLRSGISHSFLKFWAQIFINVGIKQRTVSLALLRELLKCNWTSTNARVVHSQAKGDLQVVNIKKGETDTTLLKGQKSVSRQGEHLHVLTSLI